MNKCLRSAALMLLLWAQVSVSFAAECTTIKTQVIPRVDMDAVRNIWLGWVNDARKEQGLSPYVLDDTLNQTAGNWAFYSAKRSKIDHKRTLKAAYYDYDAIAEWFSDFGVTFKNINSKTFTENIGWGIYKCTRDCTESMIKDIRTTFDFYMGEKNKENRAHYNSIMNPEFTKIGLGLAVDRKGKYFLAVHYATDVELDAPICGIKN